VEERTAKLFTLSGCPWAALQGGLYGMKKYIDAFDFVDHAIGFHNASLEAVSLCDPDSSQWCSYVFRDSIVATLGPVAELCLHSFPEPKAFFIGLYKGECLVEAYYHPKLSNSCQLLPIGDPLYRSVKKLPQH
jgi:uncharacterized protein (TIGR03790 family)